MDVRQAVSPDRPPCSRRLARTCSAWIASPAGHPDAAHLVSPGDRCGAASARAFHVSGARSHYRHAVVSDRDSAVVARRAETGGAIRAEGTSMNGAHPFSVLLEWFFLHRLMRQRQASPLTIASYRDTFRLLMQYAQQRLHKAPSQLTIPDLDTVFLGSFLDHLEQHRANSARSRNVRLAAIHSFFRYVALQAPEYSAVAQRVLRLAASGKWN